jgi:hypothetical protein
LWSVVVGRRVVVVGCCVIVVGRRWSRRCRLSSAAASLCQDTEEGADHDWSACGNAASSCVGVPSNPLLFACGRIQSQERLGRTVSVHRRGGYTLTRRGRCGGAGGRRQAIDSGTVIELVAVAVTFVRGLFNAERAGDLLGGTDPGLVRILSC